MQSSTMPSGWLRLPTTVMPALQNSWSTSRTAITLLKSTPECKLYRIVSRASCLTSLQPSRTHHHRGNHWYRYCRRADSNRCWSFARAARSYSRQDNSPRFCLPVQDNHRRPGSRFSTGHWQDRGLPLSRWQWCTNLNRIDMFITDFIVGVRLDGGSSFAGAIITRKSLFAFSLVAHGFAQSVMTSMMRVTSAFPTYHVLLALSLLHTFHPCGFAFLKKSQSHSPWTTAMNVYPPSCRSFLDME